MQGYSLVPMQALSLGMRLARVLLIIVSVHKQWGTVKQIHLFATSLNFRGVRNTWAHAPGALPFPTLTNLNAAAASL